MRATLGLVLGLCLAPVSATADAGKDGTGPEDPLVILQRVDAAVKKVKRVRYTGDYKGTAWVAPLVPSIQGRVTLGEQSEHGIARFVCQVELTMPKSTEALPYTAGSNGDVFYLIDTSAKTVYADIDSAVLGLNGRHLQRILMRQLVVPDPFEEEKKAESTELQGTEEVGGEECYKVQVKSSAASEAIWYFSKKDFLPRRVDRVYLNDQGEKGTTQLTLTDLTVDTKLDQDPFKLTVPEGFKKTSDFAP